MREAGATSTGSFVTELSEVCPPTGGSHGRTIDDATQRFKDAERRPRRKRDSSGDTSTTARPLQNLTPSPLNVVNVHCSVFKAQERGLSAIRAATARVGSPPLFAVLVYVADEHKAFETSARALFVIVGCSVEGIAGRRYSVFDQGHTPPWSGLRGVCSTCGAIPFQQPHTTILSKYVKQCTITADGKLHSGGVKCRRCMRNTGH